MTTGTDNHYTIQSRADNRELFSRTMSDKRLSIINTPFAVVIDSVTVVARSVTDDEHKAIICYV